MAERRMFSRTVTGSARFLKLSTEARLLYYDLGMEADDDGFAEAFVILRTTGTGIKCLRELEDKGFLDILNEDLVVHITDWSRNNLIRKDRYRRSVYLQLYPQYAAEQPEAEEVSTEENAVNPLSPGGLTQDRIGKDRIEQERIIQDRINQDSAGKFSTGEVRTRVREGENGTKSAINLHQSGKSCADAVGSCGKPPNFWGQPGDNRRRAAPF